MKNTNLLILFFTMVVVMLGFGMVFPIIPFYITQYGATGATLGIMMAVFSIMQFLFAPVWGSLSDRYGRKRILMIGAFGNAVSMLLFGLSDNIPMLIGSRALAGMLSSATFPAALAYISDSTTDENRGGGMGIIGAAMGTGMVLGPGLGGWLGGQNLAMPFFLASGLSIIAMLLILAVLPESLPEAQRQLGSHIRGPQFSGLWSALMGPIGFIFFLAFLVNFGLANFEGIFGLYSKMRYNYGPEQVGTIMTVIGLVSVIVQGLITGMATRKLGEEKLIQISLAASAIGFGVLLLAFNFTTVLLSVAFFILTNAMLRPAISSLVSKRSTGGRGMALGISSSFESLGRVIGPLWAGAMFDINIHLPYTSAAVIMLISFFLSLYWMRKIAMSAAEPLPEAASD